MDPKLSLSPLEVSLHGSAYNHIDGRLYLLLDNDLLQLDDNSIKRIIDIVPDINGRSISADPNRDRLYVGDSQGI